MPHPQMSEQDYQRLNETLTRFHPQGAMSLEGLDGFFAGLIAGPEQIRPAECLSMILGAAYEDEAAFAGPKALDAFMALVNGHWHEIAHTLAAGEPFYPWLEAAADGAVLANDWAEGFERAMALLPQDWQLAFDDLDAGSALAPIMTLAMERDPDPALRTSVSDREVLLGQITPAVATLYTFFGNLRSKMEAELAAAENDKTLFDEPQKVSAPRKPPRR